MKKIIAIAAAMLAAVCWLGATEPEAPKNDIRYETKSFNVRNFNSLELSSVYNATLSRSSQCSLKITAPDDIMEYVVVRVSDGTLELSLGSIPNKIQRKYNNGGYDLKAEITMPELCGLEMTGASKISCNDSFDIGNKEFELDLSGATKVNGLNITARSIEGDISGAPYVDLKGKFGSAEMDVSGAPTADFDFNAGELDMDVSGAANLEVKGTFENIFVEASGATKINLSGESKALRAEASGASNLKASNLVVETAEVSTSGTADCSVNATKRAILSSTGVSNIKYKNNSGLDVEIKELSKASSIRKM